MQYNNNINLATYEEIYKKLKNNLYTFLSTTSNEAIKKLYLKPINNNFNSLDNYLIETGFNSEQLIKKIKTSYLKRKYLKGNIGTVSGKEQYDGIINIALYLLISNKLAKIYNYEILSHPYWDNSKKHLYKEKSKTYKNQKRDATIKLIYSLFIYKETVNDNDFFYGHSKDTNNNDTFIIDLPGFSQIGVHFGSESHFDSTIYLAKINIKYILKEKLNLDQITKEEFNKLMSKINNDDIFPEYTGKFYENVSAFPIDYYGKILQQTRRILQLNEKQITDINENDIRKMLQNGCFNERELHYFAVKSGFSKPQLELLSQLSKELDKNYLEKPSKKQKNNFIDMTSLAQEVFPETTVKERQQVSIHEQKSNFDFKNSSSKIIGG